MYQGLGTKLLVPDSPALEHRQWSCVLVVRNRGTCEYRLTAFQLHNVVTERLWLEEAR